MSLPTPRLDDREFQDLVDDAKRYVMERCEGWTDHNVSDPGVTLIEAFAWMTDLMLYRLNRVPDRTYTKFLEMIGVTLRQPSAAVVDVDFRLSASLPHEVVIPARAVVSSERTTADRPVLFSLRKSQTIVSAKSDQVVCVSAAGVSNDWTSQLGLGGGFEIFSPEPTRGDNVLLRFDEPLDAHLVLVSATCVRGAGHGIDPSDPPLTWQVSTATGWHMCEPIGVDGTGGFNHNGTIELAIPEGHSRRSEAGTAGYWLRCQVDIDRDDRAPYRSSPRVLNLSAATVGIVGSCANAVPVEGELLGRSTGVAGQEFTLSKQPVVLLDGERLLVSVYPDGAGDVDQDVRPDFWERRDNFADSDSDDRHFTLDSISGSLRFGPQVRLESGAVQQYGAVPAKGTFIKVDRYWTGGGRSGNVSPGVIRVLRTSVPHVRTVRNRRQAVGGVDTETIAEAKIRGPLELRARNRAVTAEDFEYLARSAAPEIRQVRCLEDDTEPGTAAVRILVIPDVRVPSGQIAPIDLIPSADVLARIERVLDRSRLVGTRIRVEPPAYIGVSISVVVEASPDAEVGRVEQDVMRTLYTYFNPVTGGPTGSGWPMGRGVRAGEAYALLQSTPGVDVVLDVKVYWIDLASQSRGSQPEDRELMEDGSLLLHPNEMIVSVGHQVAVEQ